MSSMHLVAAVAGSLAMTACVPGGGPGFQSVGPGFNPASATTRDIIAYLSDASVYITHFDAQGPLEVECGYFGSDGSYESFAFEADFDGSYSYNTYAEFYGGWSAQDDRLCINGAWDYGGPGLGCTAVEWSLDDTLLLIDGRDEVVAEIFAYDGPGEYWDNECGL
ncbi:MAG: hypothetical protein ACFCVH_03225 [Alphaproteobacteria bacterium]